MNYATIRNNDVANGEWIRVSLFVSGCRHHCKECFNALAWNFKFWKEYTQAEEDSIIKKLKSEYCSWLSVLGWEPLEPENQEMVSKLIVRAKKTYPKQTIWLYSGFTWEQIQTMKEEGNQYIEDILTHIDVLVDGKFIVEKKNLSLKFRGSSNQRVINVPKSLEKEKVVLYLK